MLKTPRLTTATSTASFRTNTEDRLAIHPVPGGLVVVVADGAGGIPGGKAAADLVLKSVDRVLADPHFNVFDMGSWVSVLGEADGELEQDTVAGETTAVVIAIHDDGGLVGASCGDSGAITIGIDGRLDNLTEHQHRKRRLGSGRATPVSFHRPSFAGTLVVATDGLVAYARPDVIAHALGEHEDLDEAARALVDRVRLPSGTLQDDVAVVLVRT